ncbi:MAG: response regulator transcription factor [Sediminibacterium sp.]|nr:response regulator transcription factor [Sediminibacterium sp.]MBX9780506.1 response regulator transcription factor [Chitinophagaceae bacterium]
MEKKRIRVIIADEHSVFRAGLITVLKKIPIIEVVGEADNGETLIDKIGLLLPHIVITDIKMSNMDGITATKIITQRFPDVKVVCLSVLVKDDMILQMLEAGAIGYLTKSSNAEEIGEAILTVNEKKPYFCKIITERLTDIVTRNYQLPVNNETTFTDREIEIMRLICREFTSKEIAETLNLSKRTVEGHRTRIMDKIGAKSIAGIITFAVEQGIYQRQG